MKLWKKISLICSSILVVVIAVCSIIISGRVQEKMLSVTYEQAEGRQSRLVDSFEEMVDSHFASEDTYMVKRALLHYCFSRYADASCVLLWGEDRVYSQVSLHPEEYLAPEDLSVWQQRSVSEIHGRHILIVGSRVYLPGYSQDCYVYRVEDITPIYEDITRLLWQFMMIGGISIGAGLVLIVFLVRRHLRPLVTLQATASRIASGSYWERADLCSKDEIGMLAEDFNSMAEAVERHINELMEKARRQQLFIGGVTHEFKTPLTAVLLNVDTLENTYLDEEERMTALAQVERQCRWLERLVQKLLKLITLNQELDLRYVSVSELLDRVQESVAETLQCRSIALEIQCRTEELYLDADLMQSVLVNLVENAAKASENGQAIVLAAYDNVLEVRDRGIGIQQEELTHITEPFYRVDQSRSKKHGGVGLGLALVKEIVEAHHARLEIKSAPGVGTTVRIYLQQ